MNKINKINIIKLTKKMILVMKKTMKMMMQMMMKMMKMMMKMKKIIQKKFLYNKMYNFKIIKMLFKLIQMIEYF